MGKVMKASAIVDKAKWIATKLKTLYVLGCIGAPMTDSAKKRYTTNNNYNKSSTRKNKINSASSDTFGFDCVCLLKSILWGFNGDKSKIYGGAKYASNGVPDKNANQMFDSYCTNKSKNFKNIVPGEFVWMNGHIGVYIGNGLAVECTPIWKDGVQVTAVGNIGKKSGYNTRTWTSHGKCVFVDYDSKENSTSSNTSNSKPSSNTSTKKKQILYLPKTASSWRVYPLNKKPVKGNECAYLNPKKYGGLKYEIIKWTSTNVCVIKTLMFGVVQIYVAKSTGAIIKES